MDAIGERILELKHRKKELERQIRELQQGVEVRCNRVKYFIERYPTGKVEHKVALVTEGTRNGRPHCTWRALVVADDEATCRKGLVDLIADLVELNEKMNEEGE